MFIGDREDPVSGVGGPLQQAKDQQGAEQRQALHQHAAVECADNGGEQAQRFIHHSDFAGIKTDAANKESGGQAHGEGIAELIKDN